MYCPPFRTYKLIRFLFLFEVEFFILLEDQHFVLLFLFLNCLNVFHFSCFTCLIVIYACNLVGFTMQSMLLLQTTKQKDATRGRDSQIYFQKAFYIFISFYLTNHSFINSLLTLKLLATYTFWPSWRYEEPSPFPVLHPLHCVSRSRAPNLLWSPSHNRVWYTMLLSKHTR